MWVRSSPNNEDTMISFSQQIRQQRRKLTQTENDSEREIEPHGKWKNENIVIDLYFDISKISKM